MKTFKSLLILVFSNFNYTGNLNVFIFFTKKKSVDILLSTLKSIEPKLRDCNYVPFVYLYLPYKPLRYAIYFSRFSFISFFNILNLQLKFMVEGVLILAQAPKSSQS